LAGSAVVSEEVLVGIMEDTTAVPLVADLQEILAGLVVVLEVGLVVVLEVDLVESWVAIMDIMSIMVEDSADLEALEGGEMSCICQMSRVLLCVL